MTKLKKKKKKKERLRSSCFFQILTKYVKLSLCLVLGSIYVHVNVFDWCLLIWCVAAA